MSRYLSRENSPIELSPANTERIDYVLYLLNENNKYITKKFIEGLLKTYRVNYKIKNLQTFQHAMTHISYLKRDYENDKTLKNLKEKNIEPISNPNDAIPLQTVSYERLEFLGDSVIHLVLADYLFKRYLDEDEGFMTRLRTKIENGQTLAELAKKMRLHEYVLIARNVEAIGGRDKNQHIFEDSLEAFVGALWLDSNSDFSLLRSFVTNLIEDEVDIPTLLHKETNYKDTLLQYYHRMKWPDPQYELIEKVGPDNKIFKMCVKDANGDIAGIGTGNSKKKGEQEAASSALLKFGVIQLDSDDEDEDVYEVYENEPPSSSPNMSGSDSEIEIIDEDSD
jgi:dsRNA-specific ribonuclease